MVVHDRPTRLYFRVVAFFKVYYKALLDTPDLKSTCLME